ncbi:MAG: PPOX class F420-dependent oxidoreductase [Candidatus Nanopelagicales bacterium]
MSTPDAQRLGAERYISLTTFRADGSAVATPVWVVADGDLLRVITNADSWKVQRINADPRVTVAPCDARGNVRGDAVPGTARCTDAAGTQHTLELVNAKYGIQAKAVRLLGTLRRQPADARVGLEITLA